MLSQTQVSQLYVALFNRASEGSGNTFWQSFGKATDVAAERVEVANAMLGTDASQAIFPSSTTNAAFIEALYTNVFDKGGVNVDPLGKAFWVDRLDAGQSRGQVVVDIIDAGLSLINSPDAATAAAAQQLQNRIDVSDFTAQTLQDLPVAGNFDALLFNAAGLVVNSDPATVTAAQNAVTDIANPGNNVTLTDKADTVIGTANADVISGTVGASATYSDADVIIDQTAGDRDTLNISGSADVDFGTVAGIETINLNLAAAGAGAFTVEADNVSGTTDLNIDVAPTIPSGALTVAGRTEVVVNDASSNVSTTDVTDLTVTYKAAAAAATITTDAAATDVDVRGVNANGVSVVTNAATIDVTGTAVVDAVDAAAVSADGATKVNVDGIEALSLSGNGAAANFTLGGHGSAAVTTFDITGSQDVTLTASAAELTGDTLTVNSTGKTNLVVDAAGMLNLSKFDLVDNITLNQDNTVANTITSNSGSVFTTLSQQNTAFASAVPTAASNAITLNFDAKTADTSAVSTFLDASGNFVGTSTNSSVVGLTNYSSAEINLNGAAASTQFIAVGAAGTSVAFAGASNLALTATAATSVDTTAVMGSTFATLGAVSAFASGAGADQVTVNSAGLIQSVATNDGNDRVDVQSTGTGSTVDTGTGNDSVAVSAADAFVLNTGAGNDGVAIRNGNVKAVINAGAGIDGLSFDDNVAGVAANPINVSANTALSLAGFEALELKDSAVVSVAQFANLASINIVGANTTSLTVQGVAAADDVINLSGVTFQAAVAATATTPAIAATTSTLAANGGDGNDTITGSARNDMLNGDAGNDTINGGAGDDMINGGDGIDVLVGGDGIDTINAGNDSDVVAGLAGNDIINLTVDTALDEVHLRSIDGKDTINDFNAVGEDLIVFLDNGNNLNGSVSFANSADVVAGAFGSALNAADFFEVDKAGFEAQASLTTGKVIKVNGVDGSMPAMINGLTEANITNSYVVVASGANDTAIFFDADWSTDAGRVQVATLVGVSFADIDVTDFGVYSTNAGGVEVA